MRLEKTLILGLAASLLGAAADFWTAGNSAEWSERQIRQIVTNSPWAREASVTTRSGMGAHDAGPSGTDPGGTANERTDRNPERLNGGEGAMNVATPAMPNIIVRWDSAAPVCEACAHGGLERYLFSCYSKLMYLSGLSANFDKLSKAFYLLTMSNYPKPG